MANSTLGWFLTGRRINLRTFIQKFSWTNKVMVAFSTMTAHRYKMHCPAHAFNCGGLPDKENKQEYYSSGSVNLFWNEVVETKMKYKTKSQHLQDTGMSFHTCMRILIGKTVFTGHQRQILWQHNQQWSHRNHEPVADISGTTLPFPTRNIACKANGKPKIKFWLFIDFGFLRIQKFHKLI